MLCYELVCIHKLIHDVMHCSFLSKHYQELQSWFALDPMLVLVVAFICPDRDIAYLCEQTSLYLAYGITLVANKVNSFSSTQTSTEVAIVFIYNHSYYKRNLKRFLKEIYQI